MSKLHIFDMDGTLLRGSACLDISRHVGEIDAVNDIEERWSRGEVGHVAFYELCLPLWAGLTDADVEHVFEHTEWIDGIADVWADIARRREFSAVITLSPQFFAERLLRWGLGTAHGAEVHAGVQPVPDLVLTPASKVTLAEQLLVTYGLTDEDCVAYGDSASDVPLFERLPHTVAINGSASVRAVAAASYDGWDLREAYAAGRALIATDARV